MGRKKIPIEEKRKIVSISMKPETRKILDQLSENLDMDASKVIKYLLEQAGKDQVLRNIIKNNEVADLRAKNQKPWKRTTETGYHTIIRKDGTLYTYYECPNITVDQHNNDNIQNKKEEIPNEAIEEVFNEWENIKTKEDLEAIFDKYLDEEGQPKNEHL